MADKPVSITGSEFPAPGANAGGMKKEPRSKATQQVNPHASQSSGGTKRNHRFAGYQSLAARVTGEFQPEQQEGSPASRKNINQIPLPFDKKRKSTHGYSKTPKKSKKGFADKDVAARSLNELCTWKNDATASPRGRDYPGGNFMAQTLNKRREIAIVIQKKATDESHKGKGSAVKANVYKSWYCEYRLDSQFPRFIFTKYGKQIDVYGDKLYHDANVQEEDPVFIQSIFQPDDVTEENLQDIFPTKFKTRGLIVQDLQDLVKFGKSKDLSLGLLGFRSKASGNNNNTFSEIPEQRVRKKVEITPEMEMEIKNLLDDLNSPHARITHYGSSATNFGLTIVDLLDRGDIVDLEVISPNTLPASAEEWTNHAPNFENWSRKMPTSARPINDAKTKRLDYKAKIYNGPQRDIYEKELLRKLEGIRAKALKYKAEFKKHGTFVTDEEAMEQGNAPSQPPAPMDMEPAPYKPQEPESGDKATDTEDSLEDGEIRESE